MQAFYALSYAATILIEAVPASQGGAAVQPAAPVGLTAQRLQI
jgi:hypothetical protein